MQYKNIEEKKLHAANWFRQLRDKIRTEFTNLEKKLDSSSDFTIKSWERDGGGGGEISLLTGGKVFEKVGVNISTVYGEFSDKFAAEIPGTSPENPSFWASGISLVAHPLSPRVPAVHMNTRMIVTQKSWFGGGADLTPCLHDETSSEEFHQGLKTACDEFDPEYYPRFKKDCDEYFYITHRAESRGIGGIFYDYLNTNNWEKDFGFTQAVGNAFCQTYVGLVTRLMSQNWTQEEKLLQLKKRGRYVEFNLMYDRGTRFGLMTGGNVEAILMSLPPIAAWD